jgi:beta-carotene ketolase (CrtO type)
MSSKYDVIVVGAGHNGLTCACYLARAGLRVLALDRYPEVGGMTITHEVTLPDYRSDVHASGFLVAKLTPAPEELELEARGVELITPDPNWAHVFSDGRALSISRDVDRTASAIAAFSQRDAQAFTRLYDRYRDQKPAIVRGMCSPAPSLADHARELTERGLDAYRLQTQTARAAANELFESDEMRTVFASFALHAAASPDDVGGGEFAWLFATAVQDVGCSLVKGGMHNVSLALASDLRAHGGEVRTNAAVESILVEGDRVVGVRLDGGETILADEGIAASVDPLHLAVDLLGRDTLGDQLVEKMRRYEFGDAFFGIYAALDGPPDYAAGADVANACYLHLGADSIEHMSRAFAECRSGLLPSSPMLGVINESVVDPTRAPEGRHLIKLVAHFVPYEIRSQS